MSKFIKGCLYVTGIMAAVGLVFFLMGTVFGGLRQAINIGRYGGFDYSVFSPGGWNWTISTGDCDTFDNEYDYIDDDDLIDYQSEALGTVQDVTAIEISLKAGEMNIKESDDDTYRLEADDVYKLKCFMDEDVLHIMGQGVKSDYSGIKTQSITLYVPAGADLNDVDIELGAGSGRIEQLNTGDLTVEVGAGELKGSGIKADTADIQVGAGTVELKNCEFGEADYEVGFGSVYYQGGLSGDTDISCSMGNVELRLDGSEEDYDYRIECAMGTVNIGGRQYTGISGEKRLDNGAAHEMLIDCAMGNITVQFDE
ncbi:MAG: DUF4097 family beta strand repeat-containing protein [bacterium]|nr:DUF4097 family beta strand repeat-containing protein [bacterium]